MGLSPRLVVLIECMHRELLPGPTWLSKQVAQHFFYFVFSN